MMRRWQRELLAEDYRREQALLEAERACNRATLARARAHDAAWATKPTCARCGLQNPGDCNDWQCPTCGGPLY